VNFLTSKPSAPPVFLREATGLVKQISALDSLAMALSGMGLIFAFDVILFSPGYYIGANPLITQFMGFLLSLPIGLVYILFAISMPRSGGDYVWLSRVLHPAVGFVANFGITLTILSYVGSSTVEGIQWGLGEMFYDLGLVYGNQQYLNIASSLQGQDMTFLITAIAIVIVGAIAVSGPRITKTVTRYLILFCVFSGIVFVIVVLYAGQSTFVSSFNALSGGNYDAVVAAGQETGAFNGVPPVFWTPSILAGVVGILSYLDWFFPAYFGGEVKQVRRTQTIAQFGALIIFCIFTTVITVVSYFGEGPAFANAIAALWASYGQYPYITAPIASGMSVFWTQNALLIGLFNLSWLLNCLGLSLVVLFTLSRNVFAWSFDRILPSWFADVNEKLHTPIKATVAMLVGGLVFAYLSIYQWGIVASIYLYSVAGMFIAFMVVAICAIVFPYRRKDLFEASDAIVKRRIAGIPLISLGGVLSLVSGSVVLYALILPAIGPGFVSILLQGILPTYILGAIVYAIAWLVRRGQGIDLNKIQKELPPE